MTTIKDVARAAGVSHAVVSRLLNGDSSLNVRDDTRKRVLDAASELNYIPNHAARALRHSRTGAIGLAVHEVSNPIYGEIIEGAQRAVSVHGTTLVLADVDELYRDRNAFSRMVKSKVVDGLIILPAGTEADEYVAREATRALPTLLVNERSDQFRSVSVDDTTAAALATQHLIDLGHRDIGLLHLDGETTRRSDRFAGHLNALDAAGIALEQQWSIDGGHSLESGYEGFAALMQRGARPTAVVAHNALTAIGAIRAAHHVGLSVPDDISIIGFHDVNVAEYVDPPLTVVRVALRDMGAAAVEALTQLIDGGQPPYSIRVLDVPPVVVVRGSTAPMKRHA